jgi:hypothetical protein
MRSSLRCCGCRRIGDIAPCDLGGDAETRLRSSPPPLREPESGNRCLPLILCRDAESGPLAASEPSSRCTPCATCSLQLSPPPKASSIVLFFAAKQ